MPKDRIVGVEGGGDNERGRRRKDEEWEIV